MKKKDELEFNLDFVRKQEKYTKDFLEHIKDRYGEDSEEYKQYAQRKMEDLENSYKLLELTEEMKTYERVTKIILSLGIAFFAILILIPIIASVVS